MRIFRFAAESALRKSGSHDGVRKHESLSSLWTTRKELRGGSFRKQSLLSNKTTQKRSPFRSTMGWIPNLAISGHSSYILVLMQSARFIDNPDENEEEPQIQHREAAVISAPHEKERETEKITVVAVAWLRKERFQQWSQDLDSGPWHYSLVLLSHDRGGMQEVPAADPVFPVRIRGNLPD